MSVIAKFPFLTKAKELLSSNEVSFIELEDAIALVLDAFAKQRQDSFSDDLIEARQLVISRLLLACIGNTLVTKRFATFKAKEYVDRVESLDELMLVGKDFFPSLRPENDFFVVPVVEFLQNGRALREKRVEAGNVLLNEIELKLLLVEAISFRITAPVANAKDLPELVKQAAKELDERIPREAATGMRYAGKILALGCVQNTLKGLGEGKRYYGSMNIAIACLKDGLPREAALDLLKQYVENSRKSTHDFTLREAENVLDWVYKHERIGFSCRLSLTNGLGGEFCRKCTYPFRARDLIK